MAEEIWKQKKPRKGAKPVQILVNCRGYGFAYGYYLNSGRFGRISLVRLDKEFERIISERN